MLRSAILSLTLLCAGCGRADPGHVARYDLDQLARETALRDAAPGFTALPAAGDPAIVG